MKLEADRIYIRPLTVEDAQAHTELRARNAEFLKPFEPIRNEESNTLESNLTMIETAIQAWENETGYAYGVFLQETEELIGRVNLSNVSRGPFQNCTMGYFLDEQQNGKGYTTEAVRLLLKFAFEHAKLHRVQAGVMPRNTPSIRVLEKVGLRYEGLSLRYLQIFGVWEDHNLYAMTVEEWPPAS